LPDFLSCLSDQRVAGAVGFTVYESFMSQQVVDTALCDSEAGEQQQGGTSTLLGYDFPNSCAYPKQLGRRWGAGYFWMHLKVIASPTRICGWCTPGALEVICDTMQCAAIPYDVLLVLLLIGLNLLVISSI